MGNQILTVSTTKIVYHQFRFQIGLVSDYSLHELKTNDSFFRKQDKGKRQ